MSACKVCGVSRLSGDDKFCEDHRVEWIGSPERDRYCAARTPAAESVALMDFINRSRSELQAKKGRP